MHRSKEEALTLLNNSRFGVLATCGPEYPHCSRISYAYREHPVPSLVFATDTRTRKYRNLREHPAVSFLVSRDGAPDAPIGSGTALTLCGTAAAVDDSDASAALAERHPELAGFLAAPDTRLIRITLTTCSIVTGLTTVETFTF